MLGDILLLFRIRMTRKVNGFFYYFKKLPLIGRLLKESCYAAVNLKGVLSVFSFLVDVLMNLLKNLLYLFVVIAVPLWASMSYEIPFRKSSVGKPLSLIL